MRLEEYYNKEIVPKMKEQFGIKNNFAVPRVVKVVINVGIGEAKTNPKIKEMVVHDLAQITGQKVVLTLAKKAISGFKIRSGDQVGVKVTLRGKRMYDFIERLSKIALPRIRDFRGLKSTGFDKNGNYSFGIKEHIVFPEIKYDKVEKIFSLQVTIQTSAKSDKIAKELLVLLGFPFSKEK